MNVTRHYHATWIAAAERGEISWQTVSMLIEAFELGIAELTEALSTGEKSPAQLANEAIQVKNDTFQYLINLNKDISYPPSSHSVDKHRVKEIEQILQSTVNFQSRRQHSELMSKWPVE
ncbi:hypothetical protein OKZ62_001838 [Vibrio navarrensis]|nr:hypothetical protein [Vibrio navarrensis]